MVEFAYPASMDTLATAPPQASWVTIVTKVSDSAWCVDERTVALLPSNDTILQKSYQVRNMQFIAVKPILLREPYTKLLNEPNSSSVVQTLVNSAI